MSKYVSLYRLNCQDSGENTVMLKSLHNIVVKGIPRLFPINADSKDLDIDVEIYMIFRCESGFLASVDLFPF